jgi:hypothetical protein
MTIIQNIRNRKRWKQEREESRRNREEKIAKWGPLGRKPYKSMFPARDRKIYIDRLNKKSFKHIADKFNLSPARVSQIFREEEARERLRRQRIFKRKGRPIDMGGPRDVWITEDLIDAQ